VSQPNTHKSPLWPAYKILIESARTEKAQTVALTRLTLVGTILEVYNRGGSLAVDGDKLIVRNVANLPEYLKNALRFHKSDLIKYVSAFGGVWPTQPAKQESL